MLSLALLILAACGGKTDQPLLAAETLEYRSCAADSECVYVTNGCCDCANGGEDLAINASRLDDFRDEFSCGGACTLIGAVPPCGSGTVSCEAGLCVYTVP